MFVANSYVCCYGNTFFFFFLTNYKLVSDCYFGYQNCRKRQALSSTMVSVLYLHVYICRVVSVSIPKKISLYTWQKQDIEIQPGFEPGSSEFHIYSSLYFLLIAKEAPHQLDACAGV